MRLLALFACLACVSNAAVGEVIFSRASDDLVIDITAPINFTATASSTSTIFGVNFEDVYSAPNTAIVGDTPLPPTASTMTIVGTSESLFVWEQFNATSGVVDATDFLGFYSFFPAETVGVGTPVSISAGTLTLTDYFLDVDAVLPDQPTLTAQLMDDMGNALSAMVTVPEPSTVALAALGILGLGLYGWRRQ